MGIKYKYEVVLVNQDAKVMEVVYTAEGYPEQRVGARLPFEGESLDDVIKSFAPIGLWTEVQIPVVAPAVGTSGEFEHLTADEIVETPEQIQERANREMWAQTAFEQQVAKALVKFGVLTSDPTAINATTL